MEKELEARGFELDASREPTAHELYAMTDDDCAQLVDKNRPHFCDGIRDCIHTAVDDEILFLAKREGNSASRVEDLDDETLKRLLFLTFAWNGASKLRKRLLQLKKMRLGGVIECLGELKCALLPYTRDGNTYHAVFFAVSIFRSLPLVDNFQLTLAIVRESAPSPGPYVQGRASNGLAANATTTSRCL